MALHQPGEQAGSQRGIYLAAHGQAGERTAAGFGELAAALAGRSRIGDVITGEETGEPMTGVDRPQNWEIAGTPDQPRMSLTSCQTSGRKSPPRGVPASVPTPTVSPTWPPRLR